MGTSPRAEAGARGIIYKDLALDHRQTETMRRLRSKSVDLAVNCCVSKWSRSLLCGTDTSNLSATFYSRVDLDNAQEDERNSENINLEKQDGTLKKLCDTIKRPFKSKSRSQALKQDNYRILPGEVEPVEPVLFTAIALRDHVPHPYHNSGLPFRQGDEIQVTGVNENGVWSGRCNDRAGHFKFIDVRRVEDRVRQDSSKSYPELKNICQKSKSVADLLSSINLDNLIPKFVLNGFDTTASIKSMNDDDLEYLGVTDDHTKDLIMGTIDWLNLCETSRSPMLCKKTRLVPDSGYTSVESLTPPTLATTNTQSNNLLIVTPL